MTGKVPKSWYIANFEEERRSPWAKKMVAFSKAGKEKENGFYCRSPEKQLGPDNTLILVTLRLTWEFQSTELCCAGLSRSVMLDSVIPWTVEMPGSSVHGFFSWPARIDCLSVIRYPQLGNYTADERIFEDCEISIYVSRHVVLRNTGVGGCQCLCLLLKVRM